MRRGKYGRYEPNQRLMGRGHAAPIKAPRQMSKGLPKSRAGEGDMREAIAEMRMLMAFGMMTEAEADGVIARMEDAR